MFRTQSSRKVIMGGKFYKFPLIVWLTPKGKKGQWKLTRKNLVTEMTSIGIKGSREEKKKGVHHVKPREKAPGGFMVECNNVVCHINVYEALLRHPHVVSGKMRVSMEPAAITCNPACKIGLGSAHFCRLMCAGSRACCQPD